MYSFEKVTKQLGEYFPSTTSSPTAKTITHFVTGSIAASVAVVSCQPADVLRTRFVGQGEPKVGRMLHFPSLLNLTKILSDSSRVDLHVLSSSNQSRSGSRRIPWILSWFDSGDHSLCTCLSIDLRFLRIIQSNLGKFFHRSFWYVLHSIRLSCDRRSPLVSLDSIEHAFNGGAAGLLAKLVVYPFDLTKKRLEVVSFDEARSKFGQVLDCERWKNARSLSLIFRHAPILA